jgi:hypothetical protein
VDDRTDLLRAQPFRDSLRHGWPAETGKITGTYSAKRHDSAVPHPKTSSLAGVETFFVNQQGPGADLEASSVVPA